jgi:hypothetical protein
LFILDHHSSQCFPLASTVTVDAVTIGVLMLELRLETLIVSVNVVVELVVEVEESDDDGAAGDEDGEAE